MQGSELYPTVSQCLALSRCSVNTWRTSTFVHPHQDSVPAACRGHTAAGCPICPTSPGSAHLIEERVISHLDPRVVLLACDGHLHHWLDVVTHELPGFKHLHPNLQRRVSGDQAPSRNKVGFSRTRSLCKERGWSQDTQAF